MGAKAAGLFLDYGQTSQWRCGGGMGNYPATQLKAVFDISKLLVSTYKLDDVTGHDCVAPERKDDPGPAFPMEDLGVACGFTGLPQVHRL